MLFFMRIAVIGVKTFFSQMINDHALNFKTFQSRISSWHPLANFNSFLNYW